MKDLVALLAIAFGVASALSGFYVAFWMRVRNNQDEFVQDLGAQSKVAGWAAAAAGMSALLQGIDRFY